MQDGLYIITYIAPGYKETTFPVTEIQLSQELILKPSQELTADQKETYLLMHR